MAEQEVRVERGQIESACGLVHKLDPIARGMIRELFIDPTNGLFDRRLASRHTMPPTDVDFAPLIRVSATLFTRWELGDPRTTERG